MTIRSSCGQRRRADLPHAPLELLHPLHVPGAEIPGIQILGEIRERDGRILWRLYRTVLAWSARPAGAEPEVGDPAELQRLEFQLLSRADSFGSAAGLLAGDLARPDTAVPERVAWSCMCLAEWAAERGARETALLVAEVAAPSWPRHARYAWVVACMYRAVPRPGRARHWFIRAYRVAVWTGDLEAQVQRLLGLVSVAESTSVERALRARALRVAHRQGLASLEAEILAESAPEPARAREPGRRRGPTRTSRGGNDLYGPPTNHPISPVSQ
jgi:hypothetical protein